MALCDRLYRVVPFPLELSGPACGTVVGITIPPDVRLAGEALQDESTLGPYRMKLLTEKSSCEAGHMAAPTSPGRLK